MAVRPGCPVGNKFVYDGVPGTHQWYDGTPRPGSSSACGTWNHRPPIRYVYAGSRTLPCSAPPTRPDLAGVSRTARPRHRIELAAWRRRDVSAHHPSRSHWIPGASSSPSRPRAPSHDDGGVTWRPITVACGPATFRTRLPKWPLRAPRRHAPSRPHVLFMQKHWDVMRSDDAGDSWHEVSGTCPPTSLRAGRARAPTGHHLCRAHQERFGALSAGRETARLSQPDGREPVGGPHPRSAAKRLLRECACATPWPLTRSILRRIFRHHRRAGLRLARCGDHWTPIVRDLRPCFSVEVQTCHDPDRTPGTSADSGGRRRRSGDRSPR